MTRHCRRLQSSTQASDPQIIQVVTLANSNLQYNGGGKDIPASAFWDIPPPPSPAPYLENKRAAEADYNGQLFTIHIENRAGDSMQMNLKHDEGYPGAVCCAHNGPLPSSTQVTYPTGWAGRISIGPVADENVITRGSTIEASFIGGNSFIAVSYASGYTYPVYVFHPHLYSHSPADLLSVCSCNGLVTTGCNYPLLVRQSECFLTNILSFRINVNHDPYLKEDMLI